MRKIRNTMPFLHALLLSALLLAGCVREEFPGAGSVAEGEPARIELNLIVPTMSSGSSTRALTPEQENKIENLRVMVFRADGSVVSNGKYVSSGSKFTIDSYSGSNYTLFFIANVSNAEIEAKLQSATSLPEVEGIVTTATQLDFGMNTTHPLMMTGKQENVNFAPGNSTYGTPVQLHFIAAKVTLKVMDKTPGGQEIIFIGWDVENVPLRSYLFSNATDINQPGTTADKDDYWLTTDADYPFEVEDKPKKTVSQTLYVFENRRGGRVNRSLPGDRYQGMAFDDQDHRGKAWFKPARATAIVIKAMHKTTWETKQVKAHIYLGADNHSDYNIERGKHYTFTVTVNGLNDIKVDSNVEYYTGDFSVDFEKRNFDAHPDFSPMRINAVKGKMTMEILDDAGRAYNEPGFDATWLKISPLDLMWHQVKQASPHDEWQQQVGEVGSFVRAKYIPHKSVREKLEQQGITGWNPIPTGQEDDDVMAFADATHRMCYKITDIPFTEITATSKMLYVYADEYLNRKGDRGASVQLTFYKDGGDPNTPEVRTFHFTQIRGGHIYTEYVNDPGLLMINEDGTLGTVKKPFFTERIKECELYSLYPGVLDFRTRNPRWGFYGMLLYNGPDKSRNGKFLTENAVYTDVRRVNNEVVGFGTAFDSYRPMYGTGDQPVPKYTGATSGAPYYYPDASANIYHPIYKTSAARYCHEKNRDLNGDGMIDASESHWYLPSIDEMKLIFLSRVLDHDIHGILNLMTSTEKEADSYLSIGLYVDTQYYRFAEYFNGSLSKDTQTWTYCVRRL